MAMPVRRYGFGQITIKSGPLERRRRHRRQRLEPVDIHEPVLRMHGRLRPHLLPPVVAHVVSGPVYTICTVNASPAITR